MVAEVWCRSNRYPVENLSFVKQNNILERHSIALLGQQCPDILKAAYQNREAAVANKNALTCINKYFDGDFDLNKFEFAVLYNANGRRCETHLRSLRDHVVHLKRLDVMLEFEAGKTVCTGYQRKFTIEDVQSRLRRAGFADAGTFTDDRGWYAMTLFRAERS